MWGRRDEDVSCFESSLLDNFPLLFVACLLEEREGERKLEWLLPLIVRQKLGKIPCLLTGKPNVAVEMETNVSQMILSVCALMNALSLSSPSWWCSTPARATCGCRARSATTPTSPASCTTSTTRTSPPATTQTGRSSRSDTGREACRDSSRRCQKLSKKNLQEKDIFF